MKNTIDNAIFWTGKYQEYSNADARLSTTVVSSPTRITTSPITAPPAGTLSVSVAPQPTPTFTPTRKQLDCANKVGLSVGWIDPAFRAVARPDAEGAAKLQAFDACVAANAAPIASTPGVGPIQNNFPQGGGAIEYSLPPIENFPQGGGGGGGFGAAPQVEEEIIAPAPKKDKNIFGIKPMYFFGGLAALALTVDVIK